MEPFKPDRKTIALMGVALGLMLGIGIAILSELTDNTIKRVEDVEDALGLQVLGIAPKVDYMRKLST